MKHVQVRVPGAAIRGTASGVFFMAVFGTLWAYTGIMGLRHPASQLLLIAAVIVGASLIAGGVGLVRASRKLPVQEMSAGDRRGRKSVRFWFNIVFAAEGAAIGLATAVCYATERLELVPVVVVAIVGAHFFPLAPLFGVGLYYVTGTLLCGWALASWLFASAGSASGDEAAFAYMAFAGCGSALILWGTAWAIWRMGRRLLAEASSA
ncbi:hypothetical protein [Cohnella sp. REN36]|uniref:hypothetical protein n=1 Tax=Cohnella sp. REN36 TaxID=2887347 RepID=UPI001D147A21|nr:hypothetical protein [Cohnella sp. REN36]MCC3376284.1 hypothetical protein [Cohnella sp. REN36]